MAFRTNVIRNATQIALLENLDLENTLQCLCAKANECDMLITSDKKFYDCDLKIVGYDYFKEV